MSTSKRILNPLVVAAILAIQLASPTVVLADDPPAAEETPAAEQPADPPADPEPTPTVAQILEETPEGTEIVVLNEDGAELPIDTLDAVEVIANSDPVWCPETATSPTDASCSSAESSFSDLVAVIQNPANGHVGNGTIYFQEGAYDEGSETNIFVNIADLGVLDNITLWGGWDIATGVQIESGVTTFDIPIVVTWDANVTLRDIVVDYGIGGSANNGVYVSTTGGITLNNVSAANGSNGADLSNYAGTGNVTVTGGSFDDNTNTGLRIESAGDVSVDGSDVSGNNTGIYVDNTRGYGDVDIANADSVDNAWMGIDVRSAGDIALDGVSITGGQQGVYLDATAGAGDISVSDTGIMDTSDTGLKAISGEGQIALDNVTITNPHLAEPASFGAWLKSYRGGTIDIFNSTFSDANTGLFVVGTNNVTLTGVTAEDNAGNGVTIESGWVFACIPPDGIDVTVDGGTYQNNGGYGFAVYPGPNGSLTLAGTITFLANANGEYLLDLERTCVPCKEEKPSKPYKVVEVPDKGGTPEPTDCETYKGTELVLPDGSTAKIGCPAEGDFLVERVLEEELPGSLPLGPIFVDSMAISLENELGPVTVLEKGYFLVSFKIPEEMKGKSFSILFWDTAANGGNGAWIELPREQFAGQEFPLHADTPEDGMKILRGVFVYGDMVSAKVNFTGTFALIAR